MNTEKRNDEIDLIELFQKMGNGIKKMFTGFLNFLYQILLFLIRKALVIFIVIVVFIAAGIFRYKTTQRYYSSSLEAYSNAMSSIDMINYVNNIHELFKDQNITEIQKKLGIENGDISKIKDIQAYKTIDLNKDGITDLIDYKDKYETFDSLVSHSRFVIKVEVFDQNVFESIQEKILNYIDQNKYITELNLIRKKQLQELISKYDAEINMLDSLKKTEYFGKDQKLKTQAGQILVMNEKETQLYHDKILSLYIHKQDYEKTLLIRLEPITIIQDFSALAKMENKLTNYLKFYGIIGLVMGIMLAFLYEKIKVIRRIINDSRK